MQQSGHVRAFDLMLQGKDIVEDLFPGAPTHPFDGPKIPILHSVGWFDNVNPQSMSGYATLRSRPDRGAFQYLWADSIDHEFYHLEDLPITADNDHNVSDDALARLIPRYLNPALEFFDAFLKDDQPARAIPPVRWHLGNDGWHESDTWPPAGTERLDLHLAGAGKAADGPEGGALSPHTEAKSSVAGWPHRPSDLVPSAVRNPFAFLAERPDERPIEQRDDALTFTSDTFEAALDLAGPVSVSLTLSSSCSSMHVFVKLLDVDVEGCARMLLRGQAPVSDCRDQKSVQIALGHIAYRLPQGHRLRLHVASSDFPLFIWHPGTNADPWRALEGRACEQMLIVGSRHASALALTVLPST